VVAGWCFFAVVRFFAADGMVAGSFNADNIVVCNVESKSAGDTNLDDSKSNDAV